MSWSEHAVWWHVYPLGFLGAEPDALPADHPPAHRLRALNGWLDYLVDLGCNGLALGPVFASLTHGYDTVDHFRVDSRLGDEADLSALVDQASARGVRILLDGVFNHVGRGFPAFRDVAEHGAGSRYASWFVPERPGDPDAGFRTFEGHHRLVTLNHDEPEVADHVTDVMTYWLERGVAGWRLDAAYAVPLPFWRTVSDRVRARFPDVWLVGEVIHGEYGAFVTEGGLDSVTQYELWKAIWSSLNDRNLFELAWAMKRHNGMLDSFVPMTFLGNHDVTRLASRLEDERYLEVALTLLMTLAGVPSVYSGDEQAFHGVKEERAGGDDVIRPTFPEGPSGLPAAGRATYRLHQRLIGLRRRHPWLVRARSSTVALTNTTMSYLVTEAGPAPGGGSGGGTDTGHTLAVAVNLADTTQDVALPAGDWRVLEGRDGPQVVRTRDGAAVRLGPAGWAVLDPAPGA
jgi:cyclomaltodextrinase